MKRLSIESFAVVKPHFSGHGYEVIGVGHDTPCALRDAVEKVDSGRTSPADYKRNYPSWKVVPARITVTFEVAP
jgi:hypothetical protein